MNNVVEINGEKAVIAFDPEIQMLRGEFVGIDQHAFALHAEQYLARRQFDGLVDAL